MPRGALAVPLPVHHLPLAARESCRHRALLPATCESKPVSGPGPSLAREANPCQKAGCVQNRLERSATSGAPALDGPEGARPRRGRTTRQDSRTLRRRDAKKKNPAGGGVVYWSLACVEECRSFSSRGHGAGLRDPALVPARAFFVFRWLSSFRTAYRPSMV